MVIVDDFNFNNLEECYYENTEEEKVNDVVGIKWSAWPQDLHETREQIEKRQKAKLISGKKILTDGVNYFVEGSNGERYITSEVSCTCPSFEKRQKPCKHMYRLAMFLGLIADKPDSEEKIEARRLAENEEQRLLAENKVPDEVVTRVLFAVEQFGIQKLDNVMGSYTDYDDEKLADHLDKKYDRYEDRKYDIEEKIFSQNNPDNVEKKITIMLEHILAFKEYCYSLGDYGEEYYDDMCKNEISDFRNQIIEFYQNDYPYMKVAYLEEKKLKSTIKRIKNDINKVLKNGYILQNKLYKMFLPEEKRLVVNIIKELEKNEKIVKEKTGNTYTIKLIK